MTFASTALASDAIVAEGREGFDSVVKPFFAKHCYSCHGETDGEGGVSLRMLPEQIKTAKDARVWLLTLEQLQADLMPPLGEQRPKSSDRSKVVFWIERMVLTSGQADVYRRKTLLPAYGNLVDHELLFNGKVYLSAS